MAWDHRITRRLKLRDLEILLAVVRSGSMVKAAASLATSQPAVSKAISNMEHTLGVRLLDRTTQGVEPTPYGQALCKWAVAVLDDVRQGLQEIEFLADPTVGEIRIAATEPIQGGLLPAVIDRISRQHPRIVFHLWQASWLPQQFRELRDRSVDLFVGRLQQPFTEEDLHAEVLFDERAFIVAGQRSPWSRRRNIRLADLIEDLWSLPPLDSVAGSMIVSAFRASELDLPKTTVITPSIQVHCSLLATGRFLGILPSSFLRFGARHLPLKVLPVSFPVPPRPIGFITLKHRTISPVAQLFIDEVRKTIKPLFQGG